MFKGPAEAAALLRRARGAARPAGRRARGRLPAVRLARGPLGALAGSRIEVFAQNVHWDASGRLHGRGLARRCCCEVGVAGAIVGHSERRQLFGETDETVARRDRARARQPGSTSIACVGETEAEREAGGTEARAATSGRPRSPRRRAARAASSLAYEPVWAIGTGKTATPAQAQEAHAFITRRCSTCRSSTAARSSPTTPPSCSPSRTWTGRSSAARRSRSSRSQRFAAAAA